MRTIAALAAMFVFSTFVLASERRATGHARVAIDSAAEAPEKEETDEGCPELRIIDYLDRHGDYGRIDPDAMLELSREVKASLERGRVQATGIIGSNWRSIGPTNGAGRATAIAIHPTVPGMAIIGAAGGGAWKTTNGGAAWRSLTDTIPNLSVGAVSYAPSNPGIVYLGTGEGGYAGDFIPGIGLLSSNDGGTTWTLPSSVLATQFYRISVHPSNPQELIVATNEGAIRSTTGPEGPWTVVIRSVRSGSNAGYGDVTDLVRDPSDPQLVYAATWDRRLWCARLDCPAAQVFASPTVMKSIDGGVTWFPTATGLPVSSMDTRVNRIGLAIAPSSPQTLYAATSLLDASTGIELSHIYKTTDGGGIWSETNLPETANYLGNQAWYDNTIVVSPSDPNRVIAGGISYQASSDGGGEWARVLNFVHVDAHDLRFDGAGVLWIANDGGIWSAADASLASVQERNNGLVTRQFYSIANDPASRDRVFGGQQDNGTSFRSDSGSEWSNFSGGDGFDCAVNPSAPSIVFSTVQGGVVLRTSNATSSAPRTLDRTPAYDPKEVTPFYSTVMLDPRNPSTVYAASYRVWKSTTGGDAWLPLPTTMGDGNTWDNEAAIRTFAISKGDSNVIMLSTTKRRVLRTTDGGKTWFDVQAGLPIRRTVLHLEIDPRNSGHVFAALAGTAGPSVWVTADGGLTWKASSDGLPPFSAQIIRIDPTDSTTLYCGTDVGVYRSTDGGVQWTRFGTGMPAVSVYDLQPLEDGTTLRAATHGRGVWELEIGGGGNQPPDVEITEPSSQTVLVTRGTTLTFRGTFSDRDANASIAGLWTFPDNWSVMPAQNAAVVSHRFDRAGRFPISLSAIDSRGGIGARSIQVEVAESGESCSSPVVIPPSGSFPYTVTLTTELSTKEATDPRSIPECYSFTSVAGMWMSFTPATSGEYEFSLCGSVASAALGGFTGNSCGPFTKTDLCLTRESSSFPCEQSTQKVTLAAGTAIMLFITNYYSNDSGPVTVTVSQASIGSYVSSVAPASGPATGGTPLIITGAGFVDGASVVIGGVAASDVRVISSQLISAIAPSHNAGACDVAVQNPSADRLTLATGFTYVEGPAGKRRRAVRR